MTVRLFPHARMGTTGVGVCRNLAETIEDLRVLAGDFRRRGIDPASVGVACRGDTVRIEARRESPTDPHSGAIVVGVPAQALMPAAA